MKCQVDAIQWGGGGSSQNFLWSPEAVAIQWGGRGSSSFGPWPPKAGAISVGEG